MPNNDPLWYKDAIIYEVHVRAFHDHDGDGIGDFRGLTAKLDYLEDLGVNTIWVLPFYPSPLRDDGYDIADYLNVNPMYGTLDDFKEFLDEAHRRGLRVITELVINHTSDQHPWFQAARKAPPGSPEREFYVWSDTPEKYPNVPLMFPDFESSNWTWDPVAKAYYWHRFYSHQPDLNYDNPAVWQAIFPVVDFWFNLGVDGMRLDAVPYLFEREGTNCEHLPETHDFLKALRKHIDDNFQNKMLLAEANAWPEEAVRYFGDGDECHMAFHFPLMPRLFMALHQEDSYPILDIYEQTPSIPDNAQWCLFLRNHDELTLAMVTDEERDYMYRAYTKDRRAKLFLGIRHRLAPLLNQDRRRIELMNALLFALPGSPVIYYGDEIGMGDNIYLGDRNGVRTPMQWSTDRNAGFSRANPQKLYLPIIIDPEYHYEAINVEAQQNNPSSLLWWTKRLISLRKKYQSFGRGDITFLSADNPKVLAFVRSYGKERVLVVANLSRFMQYVELDLSAYAGVRPQELFGRCRLPIITDRAMPFSLGPHGFYWIALPYVELLAPGQVPESLPTIAAPKTSLDLTSGTFRADLERVLPNYLNTSQRGGYSGEVTAVRIEAAAPIRFDTTDALLLHLRVEYRNGVPERMVLPLKQAFGEWAERLLSERSKLIIARLDEPSLVLLCDALAMPEYTQNLLAMIHSGKPTRVGNGSLVAYKLAEFELASQTTDNQPVVRRSRNGLTVSYGTSVILKLFRKLDDEINPDLEISEYLGQQGRFTHMPKLLGYLNYRRENQTPTTLAMLREYVNSHGTAWLHGQDHIGTTFERIAALSHDSSHEGAHSSSYRLPPLVPMVGPCVQQLEDQAAELFGGYLQTAYLIGQRTAELHLALALPTTDPRFAPEKFDRGYQRSIYQTLRATASATFERLKNLDADTSERVKILAAKLIPLEEFLFQKFSKVQDADLAHVRIRCHGDYHLHQLLYTGNNFVVIDFEGDPRQSAGQRRIKRSPTRDLASMLLSWRQLCYGALYGLSQGGTRATATLREEDLVAIEPWVQSIIYWVSREFVMAYLDVEGIRELLPKADEAILKLIELQLMDRAMYELNHDLQHRPEWAVVSLLTLLSLAEPAPVSC